MAAAGGNDALAGALAAAEAEATAPILSKWLYGKDAKDLTAEVLAGLATGAVTVSNLPASAIKSTSKIGGKYAEETSKNIVKVEKGSIQNLPEWISDIKAPNSRHYFNKITQKTTTKELNTVIDSSVDVAADIAAIKNGQAKIKGNQITVNGRVYERKSTGTLYPVSGDGFTTLNRGEFNALGIYQKFGNSKQANDILNRIPGMTNETKLKALQVFNRNKK